ncbi:MAG: hypothetical protein WB014_02540 [Methanosarcina sp.]
MKMNLRFYIICVAAVLALVVPAVANSNNTATIHGEVYGWDTFEPLENAVVDVNSTPSQSMVAKYGLYSFKLAPGDYSITARYYQNSTLIYSAEEIVQIKGEGDYVRDLLLLPVYSEELMDGSEVNGSSSNLNESAENSSSKKVNPLTETAIDEVNNSNNLNLTGENGADSSTVSYMLIALTFFILITGGYQLSRKHKKIEKTPPKEKTECITGDSSKLVNTHELSVKVPDKSIEPDEIWQDFQANTEETVSLKEPVTESEPKLIITSPVEEPEPKIIVTETGAEPEPKISERKIPAESKEEYPVLETKLTESGPEEDENEIISLEEPEDSPEIGTPVPKKKLPLPADLQMVMDIIRGQGGRITQKDLRSKLKYSEGKVSLMLADLERRELIEKFKRGRGNVVILRDEER